jgi:hypothetical protein
MPKEGRPMTRTNHCPVHASSQDPRPNITKLGYARDVCPVPTTMLEPGRKATQRNATGTVR